MNFQIVEDQFILNGKPIKIISGAVHYFRNLPDTWDDIFEKMRALGCNTVETYCAWNMHEKEKGKFDFSGRLDLALFLQKAKSHGLLAIVRPGPYICAEWEFGGLPWWLMTERDMEIRCSNAVYIKYFSRYLDEVFAQVKPYLASSGGNVIMMQVENEYGYYGDDKKYLADLVRIYREKGIDVPLFTSDGCAKTELLDGTIEGCLPTLNFGSNAKLKFGARNEIAPGTPQMCMEMWNGWFDAWGDDKHHTTDALAYAKEIDDMLSFGNVNMYMFIGGTNFEFTNGANHGDRFLPQVTSYDYDALLTECGDTTKKYFAVREAIQKYTSEKLPPVPKNREKKAYGAMELTEKTGLLENLKNLSSATVSEVPRAMEEYGFGYGYIAYETISNRDYDNTVLSLTEIGDRAQIYVNDRLAGIIFINDPPYEIGFSAKCGDKLTIVCENMGRANFGAKMIRKKGIPGRCLIGGKIHFGWEVFCLPMDNLQNLDFSLPSKEESCFYRGCLQVKGKPCDTFLRTDAFKKGFVTINGFNLGRYWEKGPQKTLYVPASVLKEGKNEVIVFESDGIAGKPIIEFTAQPDLG